MNLNLNFKILLVSVTGFFGRILQREKFQLRHIYFSSLQPIPYIHLNIILLSVFSVFQVTISKILSTKFYIQFCLPHPILCETSFITVTITGHFYHPQSPVLHKILYSPLRSEYPLNKFVICLKFILSSRVKTAFLQFQKINGKMLLS
jgi:hypothetical protein